MQIVHSEISVDYNEQLNELSKEQLIEVVKEHRADLKTLKNSIFEILVKFSVVNEDGTIPERVNIGLVSKKLGKIVMKSTLGIGSDENFTEVFKPIQPALPLYEKYKNL